MKTPVQKNRTIQENLLDPEFVRMLQEHPIVKAKVERAKQILTAQKSIQNSTK